MLLNSRKLVNLDCKRIVAKIYFCNYFKICAWLQYIFDFSSCTIISHCFLYPCYMTRTWHGTRMKLFLVSSGSKKYHKINCISKGYCMTKPVVMIYNVLESVRVIASHIRMNTATQPVIQLCILSHTNITNSYICVLIRVCSKT